jgi:hypothetical protein
MALRGCWLMGFGLCRESFLYEVIRYSPCHVANILALYSYTPRTQHKYTPFTGFDLLRLTTLALHTLGSLRPGASVLTLVSFLSGTRERSQYGT